MWVEPHNQEVTQLKNICLNSHHLCSICGRQLCDIMMSLQQQDRILSEWVQFEGKQTKNVFLKLDSQKIRNMDVNVCLFREIRP